MEQTAQHVTVAKCQTCWRRASERYGLDVSSPLRVCDGVLHDLADRAPELLDALRACYRYLPPLLDAGDVEHNEPMRHATDALERVRALLASTKTGAPHA